MKNNVDKQYFELIRHILNNGVRKNDRTGTGTISVFDYSMRFDMSEGFPLLTSKKMFMKGVIHELIWFLRGDTSIKYLVDNGCHIWDGDCYKNFEKRYYKEVFNPEPGAHNRLMSKDEFILNIKTDDKFAKKWGDLGPIYGKQWRNWGGKREKRQQQRSYGGSFGGPTHVEYGELVEYDVSGIDQIANLTNDLKTNPDSRRLMVSAWNVGELDQMVLPPCHYGFQCYTQELTEIERKIWWCQSLGKSIHYAEDLSEFELDTLGVPKRKLSLKWTQRSIDVGLGLGFNIASYALLLHLLSREVNMIPGELIFSGGDCHIYSNHIKPLKSQLQNETYELPRLILSNSSLEELKYEDIKIEGYKSSPSIKMELSN
jgi:thymidylate synthase